MAYVIEGARGARWTAAAWIARNAFAFLLPALREVRADAPAAAIERASASGDEYVDLRDVLEGERSRAAMRAAIGAATLEIERCGAAGWNDPGAFGPFLQAFRKLEILTDIDGAALVAELAAHPLNFEAPHVIGASETPHFST